MTKPVNRVRGPAARQADPLQAAHSSARPNCGVVHGCSDSRLQPEAILVMGMHSLRNALAWYLGVEQGELGKRLASTADRDELSGRLRQIARGGGLTKTLT